MITILIHDKIEQHLFNMQKDLDGIFNSYKKGVITLRELTIKQADIYNQWSLIIGNSIIDSNPQ